MKVYVVVEPTESTWESTEYYLKYIASTEEKAYDYARRNYSSLIQLEIQEWEVR